MCEINGNQHPIGKVAEYLSIPSCASIRAPTPIVLSFLFHPEKRVSLYSHVAVCERTMNTPFAPNRLYYGDCLDIMAGFPDSYIDLICLDPPFNSNEKYNKVFKDSGLRIDPQIKAFDDVWLWDNTSAERVERVSKTLSPIQHQKSLQALKASSRKVRCCPTPPTWRNDCL